MIVISGEKIAREIGVSALGGLAMDRSGCARWACASRAIRGTGYRIERVPDVLSPTLLRRRLRNSPFGKRIYHFFKAASTNRIALDLGHAGEPHGTVVIAEEQTGGPRPRRPLVAFGKNQRHLHERAAASADIADRRAADHHACRAGRARRRAGGNRSCRRTCAGRTICWRTGRNSAASSRKCTRSRARFAL